MENTTTPRNENINSDLQRSANRVCRILAENRRFLEGTAEALVQESENLDQSADKLIRVLADASSQWATLADDPDKNEIDGKNPKNGPKDPCGSGAFRDRWCALSNRVEYWRKDDPEYAFEASLDWLIGELRVSAKEITLQALLDASLKADSLQEALDLQSLIPIVMEEKLSVTGALKRSPASAEANFAYYLMQIADGYQEAKRLE